MKISSPLNNNSESQFARNAKLLNCGIISGLIQAAVFNPWDRALYLSVMHHRDFLHRENFSKPFAGVMQTITQRAISSGLYFPLEEIFTEAITDWNSKRADNDTRGAQRTINFVAGLLAGSTNGLLLNPFSSVKVLQYNITVCIMFMIQGASKLCCYHLVFHICLIFVYLSIISL